MRLQQIVSERLSGEEGGGRLTLHSHRRSLSSRAVAAADVGVSKFLAEVPGLEALRHLPEAQVEGLQGHPPAGGESLGGAGQGGCD